MRKISKTIELLTVCPDEITDLERLHYEIVTKERILGITLSNSNSSLTDCFNEYYKDYFETFKEYEAKKNYFFKTYIAPHVTDIHSNWEIDFTSGEVVLYE